MRPPRQRPRPRAWTWLCLCCGLALCPGCDETSVFLIIHSRLKIPDQIDALCLQLAAGGELDFARRYPLSAAEAGSPLTLSVLPGKLHNAGFDALLTGQRRGWQVSWVRDSLRFEESTILNRDLYLDRCGGRGGGQGKFSWGGRLTDKAGSAVAAMPVAFADDQVVVAWNQEARRFAFITDTVKQPSGGLPTVPVGPVTEMLAVDVDNDCDLDLLLLHSTGPLIWKNDGNGQFSVQSNAIQVFGAFASAAAADLNLDGYVDLLLASPTLGARLLLNNGQRTGTFKDVSSALPDKELESTGVAVGFLNKDAYPDVVFSRGSSAVQTNAILVSQFKGPGAVDFSRQETTDKKLTQSVAAADVDGDGLHDLIWGNAGEAPALQINKSVDQKVVLQDRAGALPSDVGTGTAEAILALDLDDDCDVDLALARSSEVVVLLNDGTGTFASSGSTALPGASRLAAADITGDGVLDLILGGHPGGAAYLKQER